MRDAPFGWYATSMFSFVGLTLLDARGAEIESPALVGVFQAFMLSMYYASLTGFCRSFLNLGRWRRLLDSVTLPVLGVLIALIVAERLHRFDPRTSIVDEIAQAVLVLLLVARGIAARRQGFAPARFYLIAFAFALAGIAINDLGAHFVPFTHVNRAFNTGIALEALLFALALADRNRALSALVALDGLTGIANRRTFDSALSRAWDRARRAHAPIGVLMVDVDHFKRYNDTHGHQAGDEILRRIAQAVQAAVLRPDDIAARYGGEEFAIVLPLAEGPASHVVGERVRHNVRNLAIPYPQAPSGIVTVSVGVASTRPAASGLDMRELLDLADQALYQAKAEGRDRVVLAPAARSTPETAIR